MEWSFHLAMMRQTTHYAPLVKTGLQDCGAWMTLQWRWVPWQHWCHHQRLGAISLGPGTPTLGPLSKESQPFASPLATELSCSCDCCWKAYSESKLLFGSPAWMQRWSTSALEQPTLCLHRSLHYLLFSPPQTPGAHTFFCTALPSELTLKRCATVFSVHHNYVEVSFLLWVKLINRGYSVFSVVVTFAPTTYIEMVPHPGIVATDSKVYV